MRTLSNRDSRGNISFDHIHKKRSFQSLHVSCDYDSTKIYGHLSFNLSFVHDHWPKIRALIYFFLFGHDHSTKVRGHSYSLINYFLNCANISFAVVPLYFVRYIHTLIFRTLYSWKCCFYILYAISMAIWSLFR